MCSHYQNLFPFRVLLKNTISLPAESRTTWASQGMMPVCLWSFYIQFKRIYSSVLVLVAILSFFFSRLTCKVDLDKRNSSKRKTELVVKVYLSTFFWPTGKSTAPISILQLSWLPTIQTSSTGLAFLALIWKYWEISSVWSQITPL